MPGVSPGDADRPAPVSRAGPRAWVAVVVAAVLVGYLAWQAPHTVHHVFDHDRVSGEDCLLAASAERSPGAAAPVVTLAVEPAPAGSTRPDRPAAPTGRCPASSLARAPPPIA
jgi:hypothetical protein